MRRQGFGHEFGIKLHQQVDAVGYFPVMELGVLDDAIDALRGTCLALT